MQKLVPWHKKKDSYIYHAKISPVAQKKDSYIYHAKISPVAQKKDSDAMRFLLASYIYVVYNKTSKNGNGLLDLNKLRKEVTP